MLNLSKLQFSILRKIYKLQLFQLYCDYFKIEKLTDKYSKCIICIAITINQIQLLLRIWEITRITEFS